MSYLTEELVPKRIELLHAVKPEVKIIAVLVNQNNTNIASATLKGAAAGARAFGLEILSLNASSKEEIAGAFTTMRQQRAGALLVGADSFFSSHGDQIAELATRAKIPSIFEYRDFVAGGGLMSYGANMDDNYRNLGRYAGRILKGEKPGDLPVQQIVKVVLAVNLKSANALGLTLPLSLLGRADEVIE